MTTSYVILQVSKGAYNEVRTKLERVQYDHALHETICMMDGIALAEDHCDKDKPKCEMVVGWYVAADGESPGDEKYCYNKAEAIVSETHVCGSCFLRMYLEDPDLVKNVEKAK